MPDKIVVNGEYIDSHVWALIEDAAKAAGIKTPKLIQGSWSNGKLSAGVHRGGGAADLSVRGLTQEQQLAFLYELRKRNCAAWLRTRKYGWRSGDHIHLLVIDDPDLSDAAKRQVAAYKRGENGLVGRARDPFKRPPASAVKVFAVPTADPKAKDDWLSEKETGSRTIRTNRDQYIDVNGKSAFVPEENGRGGYALYVNIKLPPPGSPERAALERGIMRTWYDQQAAAGSDVTGLNSARRVGLWGNRRLTVAHDWPHTKSIDEPVKFGFFVEAWSETGQPVDLELELSTREAKIVGEDD